MNIISIQKDFFRHGAIKYNLYADGFPNKKIYLDFIKIYLEKILTFFEKCDNIFTQSYFIEEKK